MPSVDSYKRIAAGEIVTCEVCYVKDGKRFYVKPILEMDTPVLDSPDGLRVGTVYGAPYDRIRIAGCNAPEMNQHGGVGARSVLFGVIYGEEVELHDIKIDYEGIDFDGTMKAIGLVARVSLNGENIVDLLQEG